MGTQVCQALFYSFEFNFIPFGILFFGRSEVLADFERVRKLAQII
jgi:hypothetical protein